VPRFTETALREQAPSALAGPADTDSCSILFPRGITPDEHLDAPEFFVDLNLDQIVSTITAGKEEYTLTPFFCMPLHDADDVRWRQEIMQDLQDAPRALESIDRFARQMQTMRQHLAHADKLRHELQKQRWFLDAVRTYCSGTSTLASDFASTPLSSRGLSAFSDYLTRYAGSARFTALVERAERLEAALSAIHYEILIDGLGVQVQRHSGASDYSLEVEATFEKFKQYAPQDYAFKFLDRADMNHVEEKILDGIARLFPDTFAELAAFCAANVNFRDATVIRFDREIQVYVAVLAHIARLEKVGLHFCLPSVATSSKLVYNNQGFDLALAQKLVADGKAVVCNDFYLEGRERIIVVSGPNQGGKTTFARTFGQLHYLASLGFPVPGTRAQLFLCDQLFTHFEREEDPQTLRGKLQDDLIRIRDILERATPSSIIVLNEIFTATALHDAVLLSKRIAAKVVDLDALCVWVTFIEELASLGDHTVSMVSTVVRENPAERTYKIVRAPANGLAYAMSIAEKYGLTYAKITQRLGIRA
jgi:DNA mismatch repair protein MutS